MLKRARSPRSIDLRRWGYLKTCVVLLMVTITAAIAIWSLYESRQAIGRNAEQHTGNITLALAHEIERSVTILDLSLQSAVYGMGMADIGSMPEAVRQAVLFDGAIAATGFRGIFIVDAKGDVTYRSKTATPPTQNEVCFLPSRRRCWGR